ncbi:MAG: DUF4440 domain-containing protein [Gemmatimonadetes bacterium]|nr:DUF4440 domain-containing protein [Gemmatimonadota bacterium]
MFKYLKVLPVFAVIALAAACQTKEAEQMGTTEETGAADTETIRQGIEDLDNQFEQAMLAGDSLALANFYADDAVILPPNMPRAEGRDGIRSVWAGMVSGGPLTSATLTTDQVIIPESGEIAVDVGTYTMGGTAPDGTPWQDTGKFVATWENVNGEWKIAADIWNSDMLAAGMEGAAPAE